MGEGGDGGIREVVFIGRNAQEQAKKAQCLDMSHFIPVALRKAKIVYTILAFLRMIGLSLLQASRNSPGEVADIHAMLPFYKDRQLCFLPIMIQCFIKGIY